MTDLIVWLMSLAFAWIGAAQIFVAARRMLKGRRKEAWQALLSAFLSLLAAIALNLARYK